MIISLFKHLLAEEKKKLTDRYIREIRRTDESAEEEITITIKYRFFTFFPASFLDNLKIWGKNGSKRPQNLYLLGLVTCNMAKKLA